jgi:hypothetical protein
LAVKRDHQGFVGLKSGFVGLCLPRQEGYCV